MNFSSHVTVLSHPLASHYLSLLRDKNTSSVVFHHAFHQLGTLLLVEAFKELPLEHFPVETPLMPCDGLQLDSSYTYILAPILRAGLGLGSIASDLLPNATVYHIGMYRDEQTLSPVWYYNKTPDRMTDQKPVKVFILDPMLATGHSAEAAVELFLDKGVSEKDIVFVSVLSAPEGIELLTSTFKDLRVITSQIDATLNEKGYILPGLGDAGDRLFNTVK